MRPYVYLLPRKWWAYRNGPRFTVGLWLFSFGLLYGDESTDTIASLQDRIVREQEAHDAVREQRDMAIEQLRLSDFPRLRMIEEKARALHEWNHGHHGACHACTTTQDALRAALGPERRYGDVAAGPIYSDECPRCHGPNDHGDECVGSYR